MGRFLQQVSVGAGQLAAAGICQVLALCEYLDLGGDAKADLRIELAAVLPELIGLGDRAVDRLEKAVDEIVGDPGLKRPLLVEQLGVGGPFGLQEEAALARTGGGQDLEVAVDVVS